MWINFFYPLPVDCKSYVSYITETGTGFDYFKNISITDLIPQEFKD